MALTHIQAADVDVNDGVLSTAPTLSLVAQGMVQCADACLQLIEQSTPCKFVWIGAPSAAHLGGEVNDDVVLIGLDDEDNTEGGMTLTADNYEGLWIPVNDASLLYVHGMAENCRVVYQIYR